MWPRVLSSPKDRWIMVLKHCHYHGFCSGLVAKSCPTHETPWTVACQALLSMGFSRQEHWSGLPLLPRSMIISCAYWHLYFLINSFHIAL